jgi:hypothetical protein
MRSADCGPLAPRADWHSATRIEALKCADTAVAASGNQQKQLACRVRRSPSRPPHRVPAWLRCFPTAAAAQAHSAAVRGIAWAVPPSEGVCDFLFTLKA